MTKLFTQLCIAGLLFFVSSTATAQRDFRVRFLGHTEIFPENFEKILAEKSHPAAEEISQNLYFRYLQFQEIPTELARREMSGAGLQFFGYVSFGTYLVGIPTNFDLNFLKKYKPRSLAAVQSDWKIAPSLREKPFGEWAKRGEKIEVVLQTYPHISISEAAKMCRERGIVVSFEGNQNGILQVEIFPDEIAEIAAMQFVRWLELIAPPGQPEDTGGRSIHRSNLLDSDSPMGRKYNGAGLAVLCRDDGQVGPHIDFQGRITNLATLQPGQTHGDGVSGIMTGAGNLNPNQKGMASGSDLFTVNYVNNFQDNTMDLHFQNGVLVTNSSYSDGCNVGYTTATQTVDRQVFENKTLMHVFSAGNNNPADCGYGAGDQWGNVTGGHKMGKNVIATANLYADGSLAESSSRGPAHDGRLKPDISAHGQDQGSTSENNGYQVFGGTSGAAPGIAGCMAQLHQAFREKNNEIAPSALLKVAMLATANEMGTPGPDFKFGWGHVNAYRAVKVLEENRWLKASVGQDGVFNFLLDIPQNVRQAKVMIYWPDQPASTNTNRALVNDLDFLATDGSGTEHFPFLLDPTPNISTLNNTAGKGFDHLNNVEQIALENPAAGKWFFRVAGFEVPFGPQEFFVVWDFQGDEVEITYPGGGEGFAPGTTERIHWDAFGNAGNFELSYAADGTNFSNVATVPGNQRMYEWKVPGGKITSQAKLKISRSGQDFPMNLPFSIVFQPSNLEVVRVCPDSMTVKYRATSDTLTTDIYLLGKKYMEIVSSKIDSLQTFFIQNAAAEKWLAARTSDSKTGLASQRTIAIRYPGGLQNCPQDFDASLGNILEPAVNSIVKCNSFSQDLKIGIYNDGLQPISGATASYQIENQAIVTEPLPEIGVGEAIEFKFQQAMNLSGIGLNLKVWVTAPGDFVGFNDTLKQYFPIVTQPAMGFYSMNFQNLPAFPPVGWVIDNPDDAITWAQTTATGTTGNNTTATFLNAYSYTNRGEEDHLHMIPVNLTGVVKPGLAFSLAHAKSAAARVERLRVDVFTDCNLNTAPITVFEKSDPELATTTPTNNPFFPNDAGDWRTEIIDLQQFKNQTIIIRFTGVNDNGNNIFLDNVRILEYDVASPTAIFNLPVDTLCRLDTAFFAQNSTGNLLSYKWSFGAQANPGTATGPGPHEVWYITQGNKTVRLIVSNSLGADTLIRILPVANLALANFTQTIDQNSVTFINTSISANLYFWDFGDGTTSTEKNPVHIYSSVGNFNVKLKAENKCRISEKTVTVNIQTVAATDPNFVKNIRVLPNPTVGDFLLEMNFPKSQTVRFDLLDAAGRLVKNFEMRSGAGFSSLPFENLGLAKGIYQLKIQSEFGQEVISIVVQ